jgi:hypothetical protein
MQRLRRAEFFIWLLGHVCASQSFGVSTAMPVAQWTKSLLQELQDLASSHTYDPQLFTKLCCTLQARASTFFGMTPDELPANLSVAGMQLAVHGVKTGTPVLALLLMCPNKSACCADR